MLDEAGGGRKWLAWMKLHVVPVKSKWKLAEDEQLSCLAV